MSVAALSVTVKVHVLMVIILHDGLVQRHADDPIKLMIKLHELCPRSIFPNENLLEVNLTLPTFVELCFIAICLSNHFPRKQPGFSVQNHRFLHGKIQGTITINHCHGKEDCLTHPEPSQKSNSPTASSVYQG